MDPTNLSDGLHYFELYGVDCNAPWRGPLFRIPVTITKPTSVRSRPPLISFTGMPFVPGKEVFSRNVVVLDLENPFHRFCTSFFSRRSIPSVDRVLNYTLLISKFYLCFRKKKLCRKDNVSASPRILFVHLDFWLNRKYCTEIY